MICGGCKVTYSQGSAATLRSGEELFGGATTFLATTQLGASGDGLQGKLDLCQVASDNVFPMLLGNELR